MSNVYGNIFKVSVFGESHSGGIGVIIDGLPAGFKINFDEVKKSMARRAPNKSAASTKRKETDAFEILSGCVDETSTGTPLCSVIRNKDMKSADYQKTANLLRPGHADYTGKIKYKFANDIRGGGHFSGRITAPLVFAGAIARQVLEQKGIFLGAHIKKIGNHEDADFVFDNSLREQLEDIEKKEFATIADPKAMQEEIVLAHSAGDSVGGVIEFVATGLPVGLGEPFFDSVESELAHIMFSVPAVKGIEFGDGFLIANKKGSEANDSPILSDEKITFETNSNGGINGGITNGMPIVLRVAVKPTPSILKPQKTVDIENMKEDILQIVGRHDSCILPRAVEVVKCCGAIALLDLYLRNEALRGM